MTDVSKNMMCGICALYHDVLDVPDINMIS